MDVWLRLDQYGELASQRNCTLAGGFTLNTGKSRDSCNYSTSFYIIKRPYHLIHPGDLCDTDLVVLPVASCSTRANHANPFDTRNLSS